MPISEETLSPEQLVTEPMHEVFSSTESKATLQATLPTKVMDGKYERNETIPDDIKKAEVFTEVESFRLSFDRQSPPKGWTAEVCPEGNLYFRHKKNMVLTHINLYNEKNATDVERCVKLILDELQQHTVSKRIPKDREIVLDITDKAERVFSYYLVSWEHRVVFWMEKQTARFLTEGVRPTRSAAHLKYAMLYQFWTHVEMFPNHYSPTKELLQWFKGWLAFAMSDSMSSDTSTVLYDQDKLAKLSKVLDGIEPGAKGGYGICALGEIEAFCLSCLAPYVTLAKPIKEVYREQFLHLHGEPIARLNRDESIYYTSIRRGRHWCFRLASFLFFYIPEVYMKCLEEVWVDRTLNYQPWKSFVTELRHDWERSITPATVLLSANVGFLAIQSIDANASKSSPAQIASYISTLLCLCNYIVCTILMRQRKNGFHELVYEAAEYLSRRDDSTLGLQSVAVIFGAPSALFMWSMLSFLISVSYVCFFQASRVTQIVVGTVLGFLGALVGMTLYMDWGGVPRSLDYHRDRLANIWSPFLEHLHIKWFGSRDKKKSEQPDEPSGSDNSETTCAQSTHSSRQQSWPQLFRSKPEGSAENGGFDQV